MGEKQTVYSAPQCGEAFLHLSQATKTSLNDMVLKQINLLLHLREIPQIEKMKLPQLPF